MKKLLLLFFIAMSVFQGALNAQPAQSKANVLFNRAEFMKEKVLNICGKKHKISSKGSSSFLGVSGLQPKFSVDLLDGAGIHLFTISNHDFIPSMRVGARIKAGFIITI